MQAEFGHVCELPVSQPGARDAAVYVGRMQEGRDATVLSKVMGRDERESAVQAERGARTVGRQTAAPSCLSHSTCRPI